MQVYIYGKSNVMDVQLCRIFIDLIILKDDL